MTIADQLRLKPQTRKVLAHLKNGLSISHVEALMVYGIYSLSSRIAELRRAGVKNIEAEYRKDQNGKRYVRYSLV